MCILARIAAQGARMAMYIFVSFFPLANLVTASPITAYPVGRHAVLPESCAPF